MTTQLQDAPPDDAVAHPLPGTRPMVAGDWLRRDERYPEQMALRDALVATRPGEVLATTAEAAAATRELLALVAGALGATGDRFVRPDGVAVPLGGAPLATLGRLCQEDFAVMMPDGSGEHRLAAGVICFPSRWRLSQKIGRPLTRIHRPVAVYDDSLARRVQRLFDGVQVDRPIVRWNRLPVDVAVLHNPMDEPETDQAEPEGPAPYLRVERQVIRRLPETGAVVFSIHTWLVRA